MPRELSVREYLKHNKDGSFEDRFTEEGQEPTVRYDSIEALVKLIRISLSEELKNLHGECLVDITLNVETH